MSTDMILGLLTGMVIGALLITAWSNILESRANGIPKMANPTPPPDKPFLPFKIEPYTIIRLAGGRKFAPVIRTPKGDKYPFITVEQSAKETTMLSSFNTFESHLSAQIYLDRWMELNAINAVDVGLYKRT